MPRHYWHPAHLEVPAELARVVHDVMSKAMTRARLDGMILDDRLVQWVGELERLAAMRTDAVHRPDPVAVAPIPRPPEVWIGTDQAAAILGISARRMRDYADRITSRKVGKDLTFLEADVIAEADARANWGSVRNPPEAAPRAS